MISKNIGFIGAGRMGSALIRGFLNAGLVSGKQLIVSDSDGKKLEALGDLGVQTTGDNREVVEKSDVIFIAVKPQNMGEVLDEISDVSPKKLLVSIAAGIKTKKIEGKTNARVIRVMPNAPSMVYEGASGFSLGGKATREDAGLVKKLLDGVGVSIELPEDALDAVTGLSGSGPAYFFMVVKALAEAGRKEGLPYDAALKLAAQTAKGAGEMTLKTGLKPDELINMICSPGGTTVEGLRVLEKQNIEKAFKMAVEAATKKSRELSK